MRHAVDSPHARRRRIADAVQIWDPCLFGLLRGRIDKRLAPIRASAASNSSIGSPRQIGHDRRVHNCALPSTRCSISSHFFCRTRHTRLAIPIYGFLVEAGDSGLDFTDVILQGAQWLWDVLLGRPCRLIGHHDAEHRLRGLLTAVDLDALSAAYELPVHEAELLTDRLGPLLPCHHSLEVVRPPEVDPSHEAPVIVWINALWSWCKR
mmetsp:Transcript_85550/g.215621  ORF Transcript_85550/g.215621 Transcript_85550/m.215621 type:complete len:208 (-) Transcript_85550:37-660(-)